MQILFIVYRNDHTDLPRLMEFFMILTYYRIFDVTTHEVLADRIDNYAFAYETLEMWRRDYPHSIIEMESYTVQTHRAGFGRDPDLYND